MMTGNGAVAVIYKSHLAAEPAIEELQKRL